MDSVLLLCLAISSVPNVSGVLWVARFARGNADSPKVAVSSSPCCHVYLLLLFFFNADSMIVKSNDMSICWAVGIQIDSWIEIAPK